MQDLALNPWVENSLPLATFVICFLSGLILFVNAELFLLAISPLVLTPEKVLLIGSLAALGQVLAKVLYYFAASRAMDLKFVKKKFSPEKIAHWHEKVERWGWRVPFVTLASAFFGFPPYMILSFVLGVTRANFWMFFTTGMLGRGARFIIIVGAPNFTFKFGHFIKEFFQF